MDYKILAKALAGRLTAVLPILISEEQTGFMQGRQISENLRRTFEVIKYTKKHKIAAVIMAIDFEKCFDSLSYSAILGALRYFNFGEKFIQFSALFFTNFTVCTQNFGFTSLFLDKARGCNQGCPISPFYYLLAGEIMCRKLKQNKGIKGIKMGENITNLISQFADDTALYLLYEENNIQAVINTLDMIQSQTGLKVSYDKTLLYRIGSIADFNAKVYVTKNFRWTNKPFKLLGVEVENNLSNVIDYNYSCIVEKMDKIAESWTNRDLTLMGKTLVINTLMESLYVYKLSILENIPEDTITLIESKLKQFLWPGQKTARIALKTLQASKKTGGLRLCDIRNKQKALKIGWIPRIMESEFFKYCFF